MASFLRVSTKSPTPSLSKPEAEILLLIYIHGFKGTDETFAEFPERLGNILSETIPHIKVESVIFPAYEVMPLFLKIPKRSESDVYYIDRPRVI